MLETRIYDYKLAIEEEPEDRTRLARVRTGPLASLP
jgi:hypothetical protein